MNSHEEAALLRAADDFSGHEEDQEERSCDQTCGILTELVDQNEALLRACAAAVRFLRSAWPTGSGGDLLAELQQAIKRAEGLSAAPDVYNAIEDRRKRARIIPTAAPEY